MPRDRRGDFGTYIGIHREERGITQTRLANACTTPMTQSGISNWETGKYIPSSEADVRAIARTLGIREDFLVKVWKGDRRHRNAKGDHIVTRAYHTTSVGGGTTEDPYAR